jgi:SOS-response transcriptional repressor LexA
MTTQANIANPDQANSLASRLRSLMQSKTISECELARRTHIPQPTLHKILTFKTTDPRVSTLMALADYFEISMEELLTGNALTHNQPKIQSVPILSWSECIKGINFIKNLSESNWADWTLTERISPYAYALISKSSMEPHFQKKTTLIIDPEAQPKDGDIIVVVYPKTDEATLRAISIDGPSQLLLPLNTTGNVTKYEKEMEIIGVLVKSNYSYL